MAEQTNTADEWDRLSRRGLLKLGVAGTLGLGAATTAAQAAEAAARLEEAKAKLAYLTRPEAFREFNREKPPLPQLSPEK
ncbi:MAG TPA: hypothetical protein P5532_26080, partial [Planctomycetota bacterium]|nr:hypothetical protein [Planctomycetota bacterium]